MLTAEIENAARYPDLITILQVNFLQYLNFWRYSENL